MNDEQSRCELVSWFMDGGFNTDPETFGYVLHPGELEHIRNV